MANGTGFFFLGVGTGALWEGNKDTFYIFLTISTICFLPALINWLERSGNREW